MLKKYNIAAQKSKCDQGEILGPSLCGSLPAEKLGHAKKKLEPIYHGRGF